MTFKEKYQRAKSSFNFSQAYGNEIAQKLVISKFDGYRAISNAILFLLICVFMFFEKWNYCFIALITWHLHIMINQLWWRVANLEYKIEQKSKNS